LLPCGSSKTMVVYLVRSFGLMPESVSHDWHVQPSCQRPNRGPPKRCEFSPGGVARMRNRLSSKPYKHTVVRKILSIVASHRISRRFPQLDRFGKRESCRQKPRFLASLRNDRSLGWALGCAQQYASSVRSETPLSADILRSPIRKTRN
jgi:hypothetical protein